MRAVSASRLATTILFQVIWSLVVVSAFSFTFSNNPTQCSSLTVNVNGGTAPYRLNLIPAGPLPRGGPEIRTIVDVAFSDKTFNLDALKFPADSQFIAMVSDAKGKNPSGVIVLCRGTHSAHQRCWNRWNKRDSYRLRFKQHLVSFDGCHTSPILLLSEPRHYFSMQTRKYQLEQSARVCYILLLLKRKLICGLQRRNSSWSYTWWPILPNPRLLWRVLRDLAASSRTWHLNFHSRR